MNSNEKKENEVDATNARITLLPEYLIKLDNLLISTIKKNFQLITLSSFSLLVATFSINIAPNAYSYAVSSSILFMLSFIFQFFKEFVREIESKWLTSGISFFSNLFALIYFMMIIIEYSRIIEIIPKTMNYTNTFIVGIMTLGITIEFIKPIYPAYKYVFKADKNSHLYDKSLYLITFGIYNLFWTLLFLILMFVNIILTSEYTPLIEYELFDVVRMRFSSVKEILFIISSIIIGIVLQLFFLKKEYNTNHFKIVREIKECL